jgi:hypothetical protein
MCLDYTRVPLTHGLTCERPHEGIRQRPAMGTRGSVGLIKRLLILTSPMTADQPRVSPARLPHDRSSRRYSGKGPHKRCVYMETGTGSAPIPISTGM